MCDTQVWRNQGQRHQNPFQGVFSDLPAITVEDTGVLKDRDQEIQEWIKPNMRLIHVLLGSLSSLSPGQYLFEHKSGDVNANVYQAKTDAEPTRTTAAARIYDLHAAHQSSPLLVADQPAEGEVKIGSLVDDDPALRWTGTPTRLRTLFLTTTRSRLPNPRRIHGANRIRRLAKVTASKRRRSNPE